MLAIIASAVSPSKLKSTWPTPKIAKRPQIGDDVRGLAGEQPPLAVVGARRQGFAPAGDAIGERDLRRVAPGLAGQPAQPLDPGREALHRIEPVLRVGADRIPAVAEPRGAAQRRAALAADPDRRVRLLHRLGLEQHIGEFDVFAVEARIVLGPQLAAGHQILVGDRTALGEGRHAQRLELLLHPAGADAEGQPAVRQHVDRRQHLGQQHRRAVRDDGDRGDQPQPRGLAGDKRDRGQLLVPVAARAAGKLAGVAVGIAGLDVARDHDMVADRGVVVAHRLALDGDAGEVLRPGEGAADRRAEPELHLCLPARVIAKVTASRLEAVWLGGISAPHGASGSTAVRDPGLGSTAFAEQAASRADDALGRLRQSLGKACQLAAACGKRKSPCRRARPATSLEVIRGCSASLELQ